MRALWIFPILLITIFGFLDRYFYKKNEMFCPNCIQPRWSRCPELAVNGDTEFDEILDQPFVYFSQGKQSFVFKSADEKWVIKLFRLPRYVKIGTLKGKKSSLIGLKKMFESFQLSCDQLKEETQVVYAHLRPTSTLGKQIELIDHLDHHHFLDLDYLPFVIQPVGEDFFSVLQKARDTEAKHLIEKTVALFLGLYEKRIIDQDPIFDKNFGIYAGQPFIMDVGQLETFSKPLSRHDYLVKMTNSLEIYLRENAPHLYDFYKNLLH